MGATETQTGGEDVSCLFLDGPAKDVALTLARAPFFLRVVRENGVVLKRWDALDQLDDEPKPEELIYVYRLADKPIRGMIDGKKYRGPFLAASYRFHETQPTDAEARTNAAWREWTERNAAPYRAMKEEK